MSDGPEITPEYVADLQRQLADGAQTERAQIASENQRLEAHLKVSEMLRADLERMLANERHARWGKKSEKLGAEQQHLPFEDIEVVQGMLEAASEEAEKVTRKGVTERPKPRQSTKGNLPEHLERVETVIEPDSTLCPCGCGQMVRVGEDKTERLDIIPAQFRVLVTVRPKYMCRSCDGKSHAQAPAPEYLVPRGLPTEALVAHTMVAKFGRLSAVLSTG